MKPYLKTDLCKKGENKRRWELFYCLDDPDELDDVEPKVYLRHVYFGADTHDEALNKALAILKKIVKRLSKREIGVIQLLPAEPLPGEQHVWIDKELYRLKFWYSHSKRVLKVKDPKTCFVRGYGPEAARKVWGG